MVLTSLIRPSVETEVARIDESVLVIKIADLRKDRTLAEVAAVVGIRPEELSKIESGKTKQIRWGTLLGLLRAYDCAVEDIIEVRKVGASQGYAPRETYLSALRNRETIIPVRRLTPHKEEGSVLSESTIGALSKPVPARVVQRTFVPASKRNAKSK